MSHPTSPLANAHDEASVDADAEHDLPAGTSLIENSDDLFVQPEALSPEEATVEPLPEEALESMDAEDVIACGDGLADASEDAPLGVGELAVDDVVMRAERTDDFLRKWRTTSVDRKAEWEEQDAVLRQQAAERRGWFIKGTAGGVLLALGGVYGLWAAGVLAPAPPAATAAAATESAPAAVVEAEAAPVAAPAVPVAPVEAPEPPVVQAEAVAPVAPVERPTPSAAPVASPPKAAAPVEGTPSAPPPTQARVVRTGTAEAAPTVLADASTWTEGRFRWAGALVAEAGVELAWFDATGREVLDRVSCAGRDGDGYRCLSGRSPKRVAWAVQQGAEPGTWTVKACRGAECTVLGTTEVERPEE